LRRFSKKKVSSVEEKDLSSLFFYLGDKGGFLGDPAKRVPESPTGINLSHHIVGVNDTELEFGCCLQNRKVALRHDEPENYKRKDSSTIQFNTPYKFQHPMVQTLEILVVVIGHWLLFGYWCLEFGI
jgi:hypothetical protein